MPHATKKYTYENSENHMISPIEVSDLLTLWHLITSNSQIAYRICKFFFTSERCIAAYSNLIVFHNSCNVAHCFPSPQTLCLIIADKFSIRFISDEFGGQTSRVSSLKPSP